VKLPAGVKIGAYDYTVLEWDHREARAAGRAGETDRMNKIIRVDMSFDERTAETLLHEVIHAAWYEWGLRKGDDEERCVEVLGFALATVARDNPDLFPWISKVIRGGR
jgi:hypothetical protein